MLDLNLPGLSGHLAIGEFGRKRPTLPIIVLSSSETRPTFVWLSLMARSVMSPNRRARTRFCPPFRLVLEGELYVPPLMMEKV